MAKLKDLRIEKGLTQEEIASQCGVLRQTISNIERGEMNPSVNLAKKLGEVLNVNWFELYDDEKEGVK